MRNEKKKQSYLDAFIEYQDKMYLPGFYTGSKIPLGLHARTKVGGYVMTIVGIILFVVYLFLALSSSSLENILCIVPLMFAVLLIIVGIRLIRIISSKRY